MAETTFTLWRQRLGYGIADLSCNLIWQLISLYLMFFYTDVMGLPAYYVGIMFLVTRLVDGVADVLMGLVIDNTSTRWGRCRPWLLIGAVPFGVLCILAFYVPELDVTGKLIYAFLTYLCLSFLYTLVNIPFCAMLPFITSDSRERTTLSSVRILLGSLGSTIVAIATLPLVAALGKVAMAGAGAITGFLLTTGGYVANQSQTATALLSIKACYLYIPAILIIASMAWIGRYYRLDDDYEKIRADLDAGKTEKIANIKSPAL
ncbi:hypothetical protein DTG28_13625 [Salmonella enterica subsp. salamae]|nr:hypothetical protein [Salmonella enterica subsp. salamae]